MRCLYSKSVCADHSFEHMLFLTIISKRMCASQGSDDALQPSHGSCVEYSDASLMDKYPGLQVNLDTCAYSCLSVCVHLYTRACNSSFLIQSCVNAAVLF
jgi:hypothetical protein